MPFLQRAATVAAGLLLVTGALGATTAHAALCDEDIASAIRYSVDTTPDVAVCATGFGFTVFAIAHVNPTLFAAGGWVQVGACNTNVQTACAGAFDQPTVTNLYPRFDNTVDGLHAVCATVAPTFQCVGAGTIAHAYTRVGATGPELVIEGTVGYCLTGVLVSCPRPVAQTVVVPLLPPMT